jgi:uncharacterized membrane-anchored protein
MEAVRSSQLFVGYLSASSHDVTIQKNNIDNKWQLLQATLLIISLFRSTAHGTLMVTNAFFKTHATVQGLGN